MDRCITTMMRATCGLPGKPTLSVSTRGEQRSRPADRVLQLARPTSMFAPAPPHRRVFHTLARAPEPCSQKLYQRYQLPDVYTTAPFFAEFPSCSATVWICSKTSSVMARKLDKRSAIEPTFFHRAIASRPRRHLFRDLNFPQVGHEGNKPFLLRCERRPLFIHG